MAAREVVIIISGAHKALALSKCIEEGVNHMWTVSGIQMHPKGMIVCDEDATLELHVKTVKYFKSIEMVHGLLGNKTVSADGKMIILYMHINHGLTILYSNYVTGKLHLNDKNTINSVPYVPPAELI